MAVLRPMPGSVTSVSRSRGSSPPKSFADRRRDAAKRLGLLAKEPGRMDQRLELSGIGGGERARRRIAREERRRDHVDPLVGTLRRQDGRDEQLPGVLVTQRTPGVGIRVGEGPVDLAGPRPARFRDLRRRGTGRAARHARRRESTRRRVGRRLGAPALVPLRRRCDSARRPARSRRRPSRGRAPISAPTSGRSPVHRRRGGTRSARAAGARRRASPPSRPRRPA